MHIVEKNNLFARALKQLEQLSFCALFCSVSQRVQMNAIFPESVRILSLLVPLSLYFAPFLHGSCFWGFLFYSYVYFNRFVWFYSYAPFPN